MTTASSSERLLGGVSSTFRINPWTGQHLTVRQLHGPYIETTDGSTLIDMFMAHGTALLGHAHPAVIGAVRDCLSNGVIVGYETGLAEKVASRLGEIIPSAEKVRFVASGSEAMSTAMRLARAHTGRDIVIKIDGHFHGGSDYALVNPCARFTDTENPGGRPSRPIFLSGGIPQVVAETVVPVPWNDLPALEAALNQYQHRVAAITMVPIDYNNGCLLPVEDYLASARSMATADGALLIFDEVLSGFKTGISCAQGFYGVTPDITALSKSLTNGVPLSAMVGREDVMQTLLKPLPEGALQGGTFAGNIMGLAAADATLSVLSEPSFYPDLLGRCDRFFQALQGVFDASPVAARVQWMGSMFSIAVGTREPVQSYADILRLDAAETRAFFSRAIDNGVYFHTDFSVSAAHSDAVLDEVLNRMSSVVAKPLATTQGDLTAAPGAVW